MVEVARIWCAEKREMRRFRENPLSDAKPVGLVRCLFSDIFNLGFTA